MSASQSRLELFIDIFNLKNQRALALPNLTPPELVDAVLQEFGELEYLGDNPESYKLLKIKDRAPLENDSPLEKQLTNQERLLLVEAVLPLPQGAARPSKPVYLREQPMGKVHKLHWQPAIIGRPDSSGARSEPIAVNLAAHPMALRVSRRHARITEENGQFFLESLSQNPTTIKTAQGKKLALQQGQKQQLNLGDTILLDHSQIALKFIIRE